MATTDLLQDLMLDDPEDTETSIMATTDLLQDLMLDDPEDTETSIMASADLLQDLMLEDPEDTETSIMASADLLQDLMLDDPEDTETSIMATTDLLLELMFSWIQQRELCAEQLKKLAQELESLREKCNVSECVGSSLSVVGAACAIGAILFPGIAASQLISQLGSASSGVGVPISMLTKLTEHLLSSSTMKEAQKIEEQSNKVSDKIQTLFQQLKAEVKSRSPSADPDELDRNTMTEILRATGRRCGLKGEINVPQFYFDAGPGSMGVIQSPLKRYAAIVGIASILTFFSFQVSGKRCKSLFAKGAKHLIKQMSTIGFRTAVKGAVVVGGAVGLGFALSEVIDNWTDLIKNNHVTEASQSLRDTADELLKISQTLREQFDNIKKMFEQMATGQREHEENRKQKTETDQRHEDEQRSGQTEQSRDEQEGGSQENELTGSGQQGGSDQEDEDERVNEGDETVEEEESETDEESDQEVFNTDDETVKIKWNPNDDETMIKRRKNFMKNPGPPGTLRLALLNVRSLNAKSMNKLQMILDIILGLTLDVFLITETWLTQSNAATVLSDILHIAGLNAHTFERDGRGGGVANMFLQNLHGKQIIIIEAPITFEYVATELKRKEWTEPLLMINVYRPPTNDKFSVFLKEFQKLLDEVSKTYSSIIVTGDFNIHVDDKNSSYTKRFSKFLKKNKLLQHVKWPTHRDGHTLDLVLTRNVEISGLFVWNEGVSDHFTINFDAKPKEKDQDESKEKNQDESKEKNQDESAKRLKKKEE
ncbi:uncharacterized protein LOC119896608 [Micropterus salmoides]|uniref:uncharacterized protein LOC119896608 n=1 Tax=Micropterus salmoides TaxID=27706 RepID=UPI0018EE13E4|nr:uncharacterized protein LOC119896608 [Micropterus salmoides]